MLSSVSKLGLTWEPLPILADHVLNGISVIYLTAHAHILHAHHRP